MELLGQPFMVSDRPICLWRRVPPLGVYEALENLSGIEHRALSGWHRQDTTLGRFCVVEAQLAHSSAPSASVGLWSPWEALVAHC